MDRLFDKEVQELIPVSYYGPDFWQHFPSTYKVLTNTNELSSRDEILKLFPDAHIDIERGDLLKLEFQTKTYDVNSKKMLYKIWRCNEIKKQIEKENGVFDCVIRTRPDLKLEITKNFIPTSLQNNEIYISNVSNRPNYIDDQFACGNSEVMDKYSMLFSSSITEKWEGIHSELFQLLETLDIQQKKIAFIRILGIEPNKLLGFEDIAADNELFMFMHNCLKNSNELSCDEQVLLIEERILKTDSIEIKSSLYSLISIIFGKYERKYDSFYYFLKSDLSSFPKKQFLSDKYSFIFNSFILHCSNMGISSLEELKIKINQYELNTICLNNLKLIYADSRLVSKLKDINLSKALLENDLSSNKAIRRFDKLSAYLTIKLRKIVYMLKKTFIRIALFILGNALKIWPNGSFIKRKYNDYLIKVFN